jgi:hypothetical protein
MCSKTEWQFLTYAQRYTHTHTHTHTYIYMGIRFVAIYLYFWKTNIEPLKCEITKHLSVEHIPFFGPHCSTLHFLFRQSEDTTYMNHGKYRAVVDNRVSHSEDPTFKHLYEIFYLVSFAVLCRSSSQMFSTNVSRITPIYFPSTSLPTYYYLLLKCLRRLVTSLTTRRPGFNHR